MFTRFRPIVGLFGLTAVLASSHPTPPASAAPLPARAGLPWHADRPLKLLTLGASDVVGVGASDPASDGWAPVLARLLPGRVSLMRLGISGALASTLREQLLPKVEKARPDVVVLFTGVNDCAFGVPLAKFATDLDGLLAGLARTTARVYVLNLPDIQQLPALRPYAPLLAGVVPRWQATVEEAAARHGAQVVDLGPYTREIARHPDYLAADGYHPSTRGYRRIAEVVAGAVTSNTGTGASAVTPVP